MVQDDDEDEELNIFAPKMRGDYEDETARTKQEDMDRLI